MQAASANPLWPLACAAPAHTLMQARHRNDLRVQRPQPPPVACGTPRSRGILAAAAGQHALLGRHPQNKGFGEMRVLRGFSCTQSSYKTRPIPDHR